MADQKINALPTKTAPVTGDKCLMSGAAEEYLIDYDKLATAILNKLTSKTFTLDQGTKTLIAAINELNSKFLKISNPRDIDLNEMTTSGIYGTTDSSPSTVGWKNCPSNDTGYLKVELNTTVLSQTYISYTGEIFFRAKYNNALWSWSDWRKITMTPVSQ